MVLGRNQGHSLDRDPIFRALASFYGVTTANGNIGGTTLICDTLIGSNDFITNQMILLESGNCAYEIRGATGFNPVNGQITVNPAFGLPTQILAGIGFYVLTQQSIAAGIAAILAAIAALQADVGDASTSVLGSIFGILGDPATDLATLIAAIKTATDKLAGTAPVSAGVIANWHTGVATSGLAGADLVTIGVDNIKNKIHLLLVNISAFHLAPPPAASVTVRMYQQVNGVERQVYGQTFLRGTDPDGLWIINGTIGIHEALRVEVYSDNVADDAINCDYDYMLEAM